MLLHQQEAISFHLAPSIISIFLLFFNMVSSLLPPEGIFQSREELERDLAIWSAIYGFKFIIRRSTREKSLRLTITYSCNQFRSGCRFAIKAKEQEGELWHLTHFRGAQYIEHNHALPIHDQRDGQQGLR